MQTIGATPVCLVDCKDVLGESPVWHAGEQALYWIDVSNPKLERWDARTGAYASWPLPKPIGSMVLRARGGFLLAFRAGLAFLDRPGGAIEWFTPAGLVLGEERFNDGKCDRHGRFWVAGMDRHVKEPIGRLHRLDADLRWQAFAGGTIVGNGPSWSPDERTFYLNDSRSRRTYRYAFDPASGVPSARAEFVSYDAMEGRPDGATVDAEGGFWTAEIHARRIVRFTPEGRLDRAIELPFDRPTSVCFGGPEHDILFITSSTMTLAPDELARQPLAGGLFAVRPGVRGIPELPFQG